MLWVTLRMPGYPGVPGPSVSNNNDAPEVRGFAFGFTHFENCAPDRCRDIYEIRSKQKVHMKKDFTSKTKVLNSPLYRGLKLWDTLPSVMQKEKDNRIFKKKLATHIFQ